MTTNDATPREADRAVPEPDAIERAAKAMYDVIRGYIGSDGCFYDGTPVMSREVQFDMARAALAAAGLEALLGPRPAKQENE